MSGGKGWRWTKIKRWDRPKDRTEAKAWLLFDFDLICPICNQKKSEQGLTIHHLERLGYEIKGNHLAHRDGYDPEKKKMIPVCMECNDFLHLKEAYSLLSVLNKERIGKPEEIKKHSNNACNILRSLINSEKSLIEQIENIAKYQKKNLDLKKKEKNWKRIKELKRNLEEVRKKVKEIENEVFVRCKKCNNPFLRPETEAGYCLKCKEIVDQEKALQIQEIKKEEEKMEKKKTFLEKILERFKK